MSETAKNLSILTVKYDELLAEHARVKAEHAYRLAQYGKLKEALLAGQKVNEEALKTLKEALSDNARLRELVQTLSIQLQYVADKAKSLMEIAEAKGATKEELDKQNLHIPATPEEVLAAFGKITWDQNENVKATTLTPEGAVRYY